MRILVLTAIALGLASALVVGAASGAPPAPVQHQVPGWFRRGRAGARGA